MKKKTLVGLLTLGGIALSTVTIFRVYAGYGDISGIVERALRLLQFL